MKYFRAVVVEGGERYPDMEWHDTEAEARDRFARYAAEPGYTIEVEVEEAPSTFCVTHAPVAYDGFGTRRVRELTRTESGFDGRVRCTDPVWVVDVPLVHVEWQISRYRSGMYAAAPVAEWIRAWQPTDADWAASL